MRTKRSSSQWERGRRGIVWVWFVSFDLKKFGNSSKRKRNWSPVSVTTVIGKPCLANISDNSMVSSVEVIDVLSSAGNLEYPSSHTSHIFFSWNGFAYPTWIRFQWWLGYCSVFGNALVRRLRCFGTINKAWQHFECPNRFSQLSLNPHYVAPWCWIISASYEFWHAHTFPTLWTMKLVICN